LLGIAADQDAFERQSGEKTSHGSQFVAVRHRFLIEHDALLDGEGSDESQTR
jgi:hypothetical protein